MCVKSLVKGSLLGAVVIFAVMMTSWMVLPFHMSGIHNFKDDVAVIETLKTYSTTENGAAYMLPACPSCTAKPGEKVEMKPQPYTALVVTNPAGMDPAQMPILLLKEFLIDILAALFLTALFLNLRPANIKEAGKYSLLLGLLMATVSYLPNWNWWSFPLDFILPSIVDTIVAMLLAGLVIAKFALPKQA